MNQQQIDLGAFAVALIGQQAGLDVVRLQRLLLGFCHQLFRFLVVAGFCFLQCVERSSTGIAGVNDQHHGSVDQLIGGHCHRYIPPSSVCGIARRCAAFIGPIIQMPCRFCQTSCGRPCRRNFIRYVPHFKHSGLRSIKKAASIPFLSTIFFHLHQFYPKSYLKCGRSVIHFSSKILKGFFINILRTNKNDT